MEHIKVRDKRLEGARRREGTALYFSGHYLLLHEERIEYHIQRVAGDERFLKERGINPHRRGSALAFDELMAGLND